MRLEAYTVRNLEYFPADGLTGRRKILSPVKEVTTANVLTVLEKALAVHSLNAAEITYLYNYYKGRQDIRDKVKYTRENINNKVTVNRASQIVAFKSSYLLNEPIQYISHNGGAETSDEINALNEFMRAEDKESKDKEIVDWFHICGVAERLVLPDARGEEDGAPFVIYTIDPRNAFVIYNSGIGEKPIAGVILQIDEDEKQIATVYTPTKCFTVKGDTVTEESHILGAIPLVEYVNNDARLGAFEIVLSILNNINVLESNAVDSVQEFVNGFDVFQNCELDDGDYQKLSLGGQALFIKSVNGMAEAKVYRIASELTQSGVQTRVDDLTDAYLEICGMPNRQSNSNSTSDTGQGVIYRDGWADAESRAKDSEKLMVRSEREFLRLVLTICGAKNRLNLKLSDIKVEFMRKALSNMQSKVQSFSELLNNDYVDPQDAYQTAGPFRDNEAAYRRGIIWHEKQEYNTERKLQEELNNARQSVAENRLSDRRVEQDSANEVQ